MENKKLKRSTLWYDISGVEWAGKDMSDVYLTNVCYFAASGNGYPMFLNSNKRIKRLYKYALKRKILPEGVIATLLHTSLCIHGFIKKCSDDNK